MADRWATRIPPIFRIVYSGRVHAPIKELSGLGPFAVLVRIHEGAGFGIMWCRTCRQDVPAIVAAADGRTCCARCGKAVETEDSQTYYRVEPAHALREEIPTDLQPSGNSDTPVAARPAPEDDDWDLDIKLPWNLDSEQDQDNSGPPTSRLDPAHRYAQASRTEDVAQRAEVIAASPTEDLAHGMNVGWALICLGVLSLTSGAVLLGWSALAPLPSVWGLGLALIGAGHAVLAVGMVLQIDRVAASSRTAKERCEDVERKINDVKHLVTLLGTTNGATSQSFYSHLAGGASPELLLADLKGQLDMLAVRISERSA